MWTNVKRAHNVKLSWSYNFYVKVLTILHLQVQRAVAKLYNLSKKFLHEQMLQDVKEKVMQFGVSSPTLLGVTGNLQRCGHFQPLPPYHIGLSVAVSREEKR